MGDDGNVLAGHRDEGVALRVRVIAEARVAIEVVVGDVEQRVSTRTKRGDALCLKARDLDDMDVVGPADGIAERGSKISAEENTLARRLEDRGHKRARRALAVGATDKRNWGRKTAKRELELAYHFDPRGSRAAQRLEVGDAR